MNLQLSLKKQWFNLTKAGVKTEDYREINPYWYKRLFADAHKSKFIRQEACDNFKNQNSATNWNFKNGYYLDFKPFTTTTLTLGYPKSTDTERIIKFENAGIEIGFGKEEWGAEPNKLYFIIKHGKRCQN